MHELARSVAQRPDIAGRLAPPETTAAALELEELASEIGIEFSHNVEYAEANDAIDFSVPAPADYLREQEGGDSIETPPANLQVFLSQKGDTIDAITRLLIGGQKIQWESRQRDTPEAYRRSARALRGNFRLAQLLCARALVAQRNGETAQAWRYLEAAVKLGQTLGERTDTLSQLISIAQISTAVRAARSLDAPVPDWVWALNNDDRVDAMLQVREIEAIRMLEGENYTNASAQEQRELSGFVSAQLLAAAEVRGMSRCSVEESTYDKARDRHDHIYRDIQFSFGKTVFRAASLMLTTEGTMLVLRAKEARAADAEGHWPESLALSDPLCDPNVWNYERASDGSMSVRFTGDPRTVEGDTPNPPPLVYLGSRPL